MTALAADPADPAEVAALDQQAAVDGLYERIELVWRWAHEIDDYYADVFPSARDAALSVEAAWGDLQPGEDDGPVVLACYALDLFNAVAELADDIAGEFQIDPRNQRIFGSDATLIVPAALA